MKSMWRRAAAGFAVHSLPIASAGQPSRASSHRSISSGVTVVEGDEGMGRAIVREKKAGA